MNFFFSKKDLANLCIPSMILPSGAIIIGKFKFALLIRLYSSLNFFLLFITSNAEYLIFNNGLPQPLYSN